MTSKKFKKFHSVTHSLQLSILSNTPSVKSRDQCVGVWEQDCPHNRWMDSRGMIQRWDPSTKLFRKYLFFIEKSSLHTTLQGSFGKRLLQLSVPLKHKQGSDERKQLFSCGSWNNYNYKNKYDQIFSTAFTSWSRANSGWFVP